MLISHNWLKTYLKSIPDEPEVVRNALTKTICEVDGFSKIRGGISKIVVGEVLTLELHPKSKKLRLAKVDVTKDVENDYLEILCGAPNLEVGQKVAVCLVGGTVIDAHSDDKKMFTVEKKEIAGIMSEGMICSGRELGIGDDHEGILILDPSMIVGTDITNDLIADFIYEIENKTISHRSDLFCHEGIARELKVSLNMEEELTTPIMSHSLNKTEDLELKVEVNTTNCSRFTAVAIKGVTVKASPLWLQIALNSVGLRSVNNIVDITNYIMLSMGQPMHAFDYEKLTSKKLVIREAKEDETLITLDDKEHKLKDTMVVVCDGDRATSVAGIMGGKDSEISNNTKDIVLEAATWDMFNVRRTSRELGIRTDASMRYEKGLDPELTMKAIQYAASLVMDLAGGSIASDFIDIYPNREDNRIIEFDINKVQRFLGLNIEREKILGILDKLDIDTSHAAYVKVDGVNPIINTSYINLIIPSFRRDLKIQEDILEEIARVYGYENFVPTLPSRKYNVANDNKYSRVERILKNKFVEYGYQEMMQYSFIDPSLVQKLGLNISDFLKLDNPLMPEYGYMRNDILPSLINIAEKNFRNEPKDLNYFEYSRVVYKDAFDNTESELHYQPWMFGVLKMNSQKENRLILYSELKELFYKLGLDHIEIIRFEDYREKDSILNLQLYNPAKSGVLVYSKTKKVLGIVGKLNSRIYQNMKFGDKEIEICRLNVSILIEILADMTSEPRFKSISDFPSRSRDISVNVSINSLTDEIITYIETLNIENLQEVLPINLFEKENIRVITFRLEFMRLDEELNDNDLNTKVEKLVKDIESKFKK